MLPNDAPQDDSQPDYGILDYTKPDLPNVAYEQDGLETPKLEPDPYAAVGPPARGIFAKWLKVLTRPSVATFASEIPAANWGTTLLGVLIYTVFYFLVVISGLAPLKETLLGTLSPSGVSLHYISIQTVAVFGFVVNAIGLAIGAVIIYVNAKAANYSEGNFTTHLYLYSLYAIPLAIIAHLFGLIPGSSHTFPLDLIPFAAGLYLLFPTYFMVRAAYRLKPRSALFVIFFTLIGAIVALFMLGIFIVSLFPLPGF